jgi:hypothetical protein
MPGTITPFGTGRYCPEPECVVQPLAILKKTRRWQTTRGTDVARMPKNRWVLAGIAGDAES